MIAAFRGIRVANGANWLLREELGAFALQCIAYDRARGGAPFLPRWPLVIVAMSVDCQRVASRMITDFWGLRWHIRTLLVDDALFDLIEKRFKHQNSYFHNFFGVLVIEFDGVG